MISSNFLGDVKMYNDNLKMFHQGWKEDLLALDSDLDDHVLENLFER